MSRALLFFALSALNCASMAHMSNAAPTHRTARDRARAEVTAEILTVARRQLATEGAAGLRLRKIARELGMVSSALYRYFPSRDALLTRLIVDAYDSLGAAVEHDEAGVERGALAKRLAAVFSSVRGWALAHPNEYALTYGSPVPGYAAPADTVGPASRAALVFVRVLTDAAAAGRLAQPPFVPLPPKAQHALDPLRSALETRLPDQLLVIGLSVWTGLFGAVSFELFGQLHNIVGDAAGQRQAFFTECSNVWTAQLLG